MIADPVHADFDEFYCLEAIEDKVTRGERLTLEDGISLYRVHDLPRLAALADQVRWRLHPDPIVTYVIGLNINYTNVCWVTCSFCAFYRPPNSDEGYVLPKEEIFRKIEELLEVEGTEVLMQGGLNPKLRISYFEDLFGEIKQRYPQITLHSLSATEIIYIAHVSHLDLEECVRRLRDAGLDSLPGAGAEILVDRVRSQISFRKDTTEEWFEVHEVCHRLGMNTTSTMMYGSVESLEDRVLHMVRVREAQDRALSLGEGAGRTTAFIPWSFQPEGTELASDRRLWSGSKATGYDYLRTVAISRLMIDNIPNIQASWVTQGPRIAQVSLHYGVNDYGSTMMEENVVSAAGTSFRFGLEEMLRSIREAGFEPRRRNTRYELLPDPTVLGQAVRT